MKQTITKLQYVIDDDILRSAISKAGYRERSCMMYTKEITIRRDDLNGNPIIRFTHIDGQQFAEFDANGDCWVN